MSVDLTKVSKELRNKMRTDVQVKPVAPSNGEMTVTIKVYGDQDLKRICKLMGVPNATLEELFAPPPPWYQKILETTEQEGHTFAEINQGMVVITRRFS